MGRAAASPTTARRTPPPTTPTTASTSTSRTSGSEGYYGYCTSDDTSGAHQVAAYCALDDDFARSQFGALPAELPAGHRGPRVLPRHPVRLRRHRGDLVHGGVGDLGGGRRLRRINDNYQYLYSSPITHSRTPLDYAGGSYPYGSFIFFKYASQRLGNDVVRRFWNGAIGAPRSAPAIRSVIGTTAWPAFFTLFASWNTLPRAQLHRAGRLPRTRVVAPQDDDRSARDHRPAVGADPAPRQRRRPGHARPAPLAEQAPARHRRRAVHLDGFAGDAPASLRRRAGLADDDPAHRRRQPAAAGGLQPQGAPVAWPLSSPTPAPADPPGCSR